ncbi:MAG: DUF5615 family PIN-like protein [Acidobacteriota bacterium]
MKVRFQADADLNRRIVKAVRRREPDLDFQDAVTTGFEGLSDLEVLGVAAEAGRVIISHDRRTMPGWFAAFVAQFDSPGLIVVPQKMPIAQAAEELVLIWAATEAEEWKNQVCVLPL